MSNLGVCPVYIRIIKFRRISYVSTGVKLDPIFWSEDGGKVRKGHPNSVRYNHYLQGLIVKYTDEMLRIESQDAPVNAKKIKQVITGSSIPLFFDYSNEILNRYKHRGSSGTFDKSSSIIKKLKEYVKTDKLMFQDIDIRFLAQYQDYLSSKLGNKVNTIGKDFKFIRTIFKYAIKEGIVSSDQNPFRAFKINSEPTTKVFLEEAEIDLLKAFNGTKLMNQCRDIVLFQYYSGGIRISDALLLKVRNVQGGRLSLRIKKTGEQLSHGLTDTALDILKLYTEQKQINDYVFEFISSEIDDKDPFVVDRAISGATALINKTLKVIARKLRIDKEISSHTFRHSFAINAIKKGISIEYIQKILKHSNIRETLVYAKIQDKEIDSVLSKFDK
jgi:site-specific recombinase XerD